MDKWVVHKFGGSSVADAACFRQVAEIVEASSKPREAIVLSACRGVTDSLLELVTLAQEPNKEFGPSLRALKARHLELAAELISKSAYETYKAQFERDCLDIAGMLQTVRLIRSSTYSMRDVIAGFGEIWSTRLFAPFLRERARIKGDILWVDAREVIIVEWGSLGAAVQWSASEAKLRQLVPPNFAGRLIVTGFIATTTKGKQTTLGRNGSDFSGSIFGALLDAVEIIIWTDVDGVLSADPRLVPNAQVIDQLSYNEAMELAYFGAKVIHPQTMAPAVARDIPIFIRNTFAPQKRGTLICANPVSALKVKGITTIDPVALVNLEGAGMIGVPGTAHRLFGALRDSGISVILISQGSSEHSICFAIPEAQAVHAEEAVRRAFEAELRDGQIQHVEVALGMSILAVVGDGMGRTWCRCESVQFSRRSRDQRAGDCPRGFRTQYFGRRRRQGSGQGAARGACGILPLAQHAIDRLGRAGHGRARAAGANRHPNRTLERAEGGFTGSRHHHLDAHAARRAIGGLEPLEGTHGAGRRAARHEKVHRPCSSGLCTAHRDHRLHGERRGRRPVSRLAVARHSHRHAKQESQQRPASLLPSVARGETGGRYALSLRGHGGCRIAGHSDPARPARNRR